MKGFTHILEEWYVKSHFTIPDVSRLPQEIHQSCPWNEETKKKEKHFFHSWVILKLKLLEEWDFNLSRMHLSAKRNNNSLINDFQKIAIDEDLILKNNFPVLYQSLLHTKLFSVLQSSSVQPLL